MDEIRRIVKKEERYAIGLMSGSSCDGIDAVLVRMKGTGKNIAVKLALHRYFKYTESFKLRLLDEHKPLDEVCRLNFEVGQRLAAAANEMISLANKERLGADFVASHGHTVAHIPPPAESFGTMQIGEPAVIAERTGLPVVSDFRQRDMAAGGQGAPLATYADWILFHREDRNVAVLNIGGIANIAGITPNFDKVISFDTGPGNMIIDGAMRLVTRGEHHVDKDGAIAAKGRLREEFLEYLMGHAYFDRVPPKSTGREDFGEDVFLRDAILARRNYAYEDIITTVTTAVAKSIVEAYTRYVKPYCPVKTVIVAGGGANNKTLMAILQIGFRHEDIKVASCEQYGIPTGAREAMAFAVLGNETLFGTKANMPTSTGAKHPVVLGKITPP